MDLFDLDRLREAIKKAPEVALQSKLDMLLGIGRNPATGRIEQNLRPLFDREALEKNRKMIDIIESEGFKELEERMRKSARQMGKSFENIEARALFTNACQLGRHKSNLTYFTDLINSTDFWANPRVQIDEDYAEHCTDLDNRPNFLAWCISQMHRPVTTNLGATPCFMII